MFFFLEYKQFNKYVNLALQIFPLGNIWALYTQKKKKKDVE